VEQAFAFSPEPVASRLEVLEQHFEVLVQTPAAHAERRRNQVRCLGALVAVTGLVLASLHLGFLALIPLGVAAAAGGPRRIRQKVLFRVLKEPEECLVTPIAHVMTHSIVRIDGRYETNGWDGRSFLIGSLTNGEERTLLELPGTDEALARAACEQLALLCRCSVEYTGPFGDRISFGPAAS
jgi:hypothetical protein